MTVDIRTNYVQYRKVLGIAALMLAATVILTAFVSVGVGEEAPDCSMVTYDGEGTEDEPYKVEDVNQLQCIEERDLSADYLQTGEINATQTGEWNAGDGFEPIGHTDRDEDVEFAGTYDGGGFNITGLTIERPDEDYVGLFGGIEDSSIENVALVDVDVTGKWDVGGLVGTANSDGEITGSHATGKVSGDGVVGGLAGSISHSSTIVDSYAVVHVEGGNNIGGLVGNVFTESSEVVGSYAKGDVDGDESVGGLVARTYGPVSESYSTGDVDGEEAVGGLVGRNGGTVYESYAAGAVSGDRDIGGLIGRNGADATLRDGPDGTVRDSYWDTENTSQDEAIGQEGGEDYEGQVGGDSILEGEVGGLTTTEMQGEGAENSMSALDFAVTWRVLTDPEGYPVLEWQKGVEDPDRTDGEDSEDRDNPFVDQGGEPLSEEDVSSRIFSWLGNGEIEDNDYSQDEVSSLIFEWLQAD